MSLTPIVQDGTEKSRQIFITVPTEVGQTEAEEIGGLLMALLAVKMGNCQQGTSAWRRRLACTR